MNVRMSCFKKFWTLKMNCNKFILIIFLYFLENHPILQISGEWINKTKQLKEKVKKLYGKTSSFKNESMSVGYRPLSLLDYPGDNKKKLEIIENVWKDYYDCLKAKSDAMSEVKTMPPYTITSFIENAVQLDCNICISPEDLLDTVEWYYTEKPYGSQPELVEEDEYKQITLYTFTLNLIKLRSFHQGMYYCKLKTEVDAPYFLHVLNSHSEPLMEVKSKFSKIGPYVQNPVQIPGTNMVLWNDWTDWTKCSRCKKVGKRMKIGYCKISLMQNLPESITSTLSILFKFSSVNVDTQIVRETEELLKIFVHGIPCRSPLLPNTIRENAIVTNFSTQIMSGFCKVHCESDVIVEVLNKDGNIIDEYNNTAGEYYSLQDIPPLPEHAEQVAMYADIGKPFVIQCPNKLRRNTPVEWSVGGKVWLKDAIELISKGRITLNNLNEIVFREINEIDKKIYSCWQDGESVGVVRLLVNEKPSYIKEYLLTLELYPIVMFMAIIMTFFYVAIRMCLNRNKARMGAVVSKKGKKKFVEFLNDSYRDKYDEKEK